MGRPGGFLRSLLAGLGVVTMAGVLLAMVAGRSGASAAPSELPYRVYVPMTVRDEPKIPRYLKVVPPAGGVYHAAFPDFSGPGGVTVAKMAAFEGLAGKGVAWAYFSNNWFDGIAFPAESARAIHDAGVVPFIRMLPRSTYDEYKAEPVYSLEAINSGKFDTELALWARDARSAGYPLMLQFGAEVNRDWYSWNGKYHGGGPDGPRLYREAHRRVVDIFRREEAWNVTWVFHVDVQTEPNVAWNAMANYYPGDEYIDWLGISVHPTQTEAYAWWTFTSVLDSGYAELSALSPSKPIAVLEWGVTDGHPGGDKAAWIRDALVAVRSGRYPRIKAIAYWHQNYEHNRSPARLRIDSSQSALDAYRAGVADSFFVSKATVAVVISP